MTGTVRRRPCSFGGRVKDEEGLGDVLSQKNALLDETGQFV